MPYSRRNKHIKEYLEFTNSNIIVEAIFNVAPEDDKTDKKLINKLKADYGDNVKITRDSDNNIVIDYKTTSEADSDNFAKEIRNIASGAIISFKKFINNWRKN